MSEPSDMSNDEVVDLFNTIEAEEGAKGPKGEKAEIIRSLIRQAITAVKPASGEISLSTLRKYCYAILIKRAVKSGIPEEEARHGKKTGEIDPVTQEEVIDTTNMVRLDQSYFAGVINNTWRTRKDESTKSVIVIVNEELPPKIREPKKPGKKSKKVNASADDLGDGSSDQ